MKQTIIMFFILTCIVPNANAQMYEYIADSGQKFYGYKHKYGEPCNMQEVNFVEAQEIFTSIQSESLDNVEEVQERAEQDFRDKIEALYNKNKAYMWEHVPDCRYTFEEVYQEVRKHSFRIDYRDSIDSVFTCVINAHIVYKLNVNKFYSKPYILGYLYIDEETKNKIVDDKK